MRLVWLLALAACYQPSPGAGSPCARGTDCPAPLMCDRGICVAEPVEVDGGVEPDGPPPPDGQLTCIERWQAGSIATQPAPAAGINTASTELNPYVVGDTLYFASNRAGPADIYRATRSGNTFIDIAPVTDLNSASEEGSLSISPDGLSAFLSSDRAGAPVGGRNLWMGTRSLTSEPFGNFTVAPFANVNTAGNEYEVWVSDDRLRLYVSSSGNGDQTIALSTRTGTADVFPAPAPIPELTSPMTECCHSLTSDERVIVFVSSRSGANQLYYATRSSRTAAFSQPQLVPGAGVTPLHTSLAPDGCTLYIASPRAGGAGSFDVWVTGIGP